MGKNVESCGSSAPGKSGPLIPQCPAREESWMEPQPGSAALANQLNLLFQLLSSLVWVEQGTVLLPLPRSLD